MPLALALDTTSAFGSVALVDSERTLEEVLIHAPEGFSPVVFGEIEALLSRHALRLDEVALFAAASGPGSFTGVRVGLAAVKGLAEALGRPAVAVSNLQALAELGSATLRATVLDARRDQAYAAVYDGGLRPVQPEVVVPFPEWLARLPVGDVEFLSPDFAPFRAALAGTAHAEARVMDGLRALAAPVGRIALGRLQSGDVGDPALLDANYVRRSDAELFWREA